MNNLFTMTQPPQHSWFMALVPILTQASHLLLAEYQYYCNGDEFKILEKNDNSPVTQADLRVNQYLIQQLQQLTPNIPILSEESDYTQRHTWSMCWLLDPLDGTKEFLHRSNQFTINLSLIEQGKTIFSAIAVPCEQVIYLADTQHLPYKYHIADDEWQQYTPQHRGKRDTLYIATSHRSHSPLYPKFMDYLQQKIPIRFIAAGSAYKFCMMLEGKIDLYPRFHPTSEWDTSAGQGLLEQIGGGLLALNQKPFTYNQRAELLNGGFIAVTDCELFALAFEAWQAINSSNSAK